MSTEAAQSKTDQHRSQFSGRSNITAHYLTDETALVNALIEKARLSRAENRKVEDIARQLVQAVRVGRRRFGGIDAFIHEYGLTTEEGIIMMCLAEALLRIPDAGTADQLIADKISEGDWAGHLGRSDSLFVNASTWGLMLTGRLIDLRRTETGDAAGLIKRLVGRSGEPIIREAMRHAMRILGDQFVLGRTIKEAIGKARAYEKRGYRFSYDMLGEAAWTAADAKRYFVRYQDALEEIASAAGAPVQRDFRTLMVRPSISVKLSALHPRFEPAKEVRVRREVLPRLLKLAHTCRDHWLALTIDAEEADRLDLTLQILADAFADPSLDGWDGLGIAVQAYGKRTLPVLEWLDALAAAAGRRIPVRLVKGAYWDSEIKFAQEQGLDGYPVFTRKVNTDISYIAATRYLLDQSKTIYPQFATHNARSVATVLALAPEKGTYEFQRLHGMGEGLYNEIAPENAYGQPCRIYAPVGGHEDLLAYLVRRLLENGANASFVHRIADDEAPIGAIIRDPVHRIAGDEEKAHPHIPSPPDLFAPSRQNSQGLPLWQNELRGQLAAEMEAWADRAIEAGPIIDGVVMNEGGDMRRAPYDRRIIIGQCASTDPGLVDNAVRSALQAGERWDRLGGESRANILETAADLYETNRPRLMSLLVREAGKTLANALSEVREAVDFLRYYAAEARVNFTAAEDLGGPTGERNSLTLHARGVFACISPWNFPLAIFTGQIAAALAAGNGVAAKPAEQTPLIGALAVQLLHEAGVPAEVLQFLPGPGDVVGARLVSNHQLSGVAFTGSTVTAKAINVALAERTGPLVPLIAETGGINAMIVDSTALPEQVVRDAVASAFDGAGQRCSALRLLLLQEDIADRMLEMLIGAMQELQLGDPMDYATDIGPVIDDEAAAHLEQHKSHMRGIGQELINLSVPEACAHGAFVGPALYEIEEIGVLKEEVFGPILHVTRYRPEDLGGVCEAVNALGYGLTLGVHSRIASTVDFIAERMHVGNIYVNRNQIGAVVGVQPFGGEGLSGTGPKAGGPNYLQRFAVERVRSEDLTASGGNATLLSLRPDMTESSG
ncbi:bifunctional protein PutA [bacterium MnTg02]|nr:bifunctional protein PutA [bacterium MnTg02]